MIRGTQKGVQIRDNIIINNSQYMVDFEPSSTNDRTYELEITSNIFLRTPKKGLINKLRFLYDLYKFL